jgi:hypothetical protein
MTARDLVSAILRLIGAIAPGESPASSEANDALSAINRMLDSWSNEGLMIFATKIEASIPLIVGQPDYTLGTAGDITVRPMTIEAATAKNIASGVEYPVRILTTTEYAHIQNKSLESSIPEFLFDDGGYPQRTLYVYPVPSSSAFALNLLTKRPISTIASLDDTISFPPGYEDAIIYSGAMRLAPEYGRPADPLIIQTANDAKASIKRSNFRPRVLQVNDVPSNFSGIFNINKGNSTR